MLDERNHRLSHCLGYGAFDPGGRVGKVKELEFGSRRERPDFLVVRSGFVRRRWLRIPVEQVVVIDPGKRRIVVQGSPVGRVRFGSVPDKAVEGAELPLASVRRSRRSNR